MPSTLSLNFDGVALCIDKSIVISSDSLLYIFKNLVADPTSVNTVSKVSVSVDVDKVGLSPVKVVSR